MLVVLVVGLGGLLRPLYAATTLVLVEPSTVWDKHEQQVPGNSLVDGVVEIMRSEPVLEEALAGIGVIDAADWGGLLELNPAVLDFLRMDRRPAPPDALGHKVYAAEALAIHRRGLTPVIAVTARAASAGLAARLANAIGEAHIALQVRAKSEALDEARALVDAQRADIAREREEAVGAGHADVHADRDYERLSLLSAELREQAELQLPDYRIVAPAQVPQSPVSPDMKTILALTIVLGLPFVVVLVLAHDIVTTGIRSVGDLAEVIGMPASQVLTVMAARKRYAKGAVDAQARAFSPHADSMRLLVARVMRSAARGAGARIVAVCSPDGGGPKTMTALGLARMMAGNGQRVLLIDANGEAGVLARLADLPHASRVTGFAQELGQMALLLQRDPLSSVSLLLNVAEGAGHGRDDEARALPNVLRAARSSFDYVIIDMPHGRRIGKVAGALARVDAIVLVASWRGTVRDAVRETMALIGDIREGAALLPVLAGQPDNGQGYDARLSGELT